MTKKSLIELVNRWEVDEHKPSVQVTPSGSFVTVTDGYCPELDDIAYIVLSEPCKTLQDVAYALGRSKNCVSVWAKRHKSFKEAILGGLEEGKRKFIKQMYDHAFLPSAGVNTQLIKMLGKTIYGIDADTQFVFVEAGDKRKLSDGESARLYRDVLNEIDESEEIFLPENDIEVDFSEVDNEN